MLSPLPPPYPSFATPIATPSAATTSGRGRCCVADGPPRSPGDEGSGKSSLVARLQGRKLDERENPLGTGLEYAYVNVKDPEQEGESARHADTGRRGLPPPPAASALPPAPAGTPGPRATRRVSATRPDTSPSLDAGAYAAS